MLRHRRLAKSHLSLRSRHKRHRSPDPRSKHLLGILQFLHGLDGVESNRPLPSVPNVDQRPGLTGPSSRPFEQIGFGFWARKRVWRFNHRELPIKRGLFSFTMFSQKPIDILILDYETSLIPLTAWYILLVNGIILFGVLTLYLLDEIFNYFRKPHVVKL